MWVLTAESVGQHDGWTPLYIAAKNGHAGVMDLLVQAKCDVDKANVNPRPETLDPKPRSLRRRQGDCELDDCVWRKRES
eukprot:864783-Rhodomonas_salina.1